MLTFIFGHAFEETALTGIPTSFDDRDHSAESAKFAQLVHGKETFAWKQRPSGTSDNPDLLHEHTLASLIIPAGWSHGLIAGDPVPLQLYVDGSDTTTGDQVTGAIQQALGDFQLQYRQEVIDQLPSEVFDLAQQLPVEVRKQFVSLMELWSVKTEVLYNPNQRFINFIVPGIIGLILQLLTVTLMACTISRERETGTLYQLMVTSLQRTDIVLGKVLPYLLLSMFLIVTTVAVAYFHFDTQFQRPLVLALICFLFLCCSLGLGLLISAFCHTQAQAIQFAVFYLLPVFPLSGAFAPLDQLPPGIRMLSQTFPLTHFCHAFRLVNLCNAELSFIGGDLVFLALGAVVTCAGAGILLRRIQE
jgi:ABC-type multidrug transport system permease subunit